MFKQFIATCILLSSLTSFAQTISTVRSIECKITGLNILNDQVFNGGLL